MSDPQENHDPKDVTNFSDILTSADQKSRGATAAIATMREIPGVKSSHKDISSAARAIGEIADVPYSGATNGLGRDVATRIAEIEQRLREINDDMDASKKFATQQAANIRTAHMVTIKHLEEQRDTLIDHINENSAAEVAVLRGRETDLIKALGHLQGVQKALQTT